MMQARIIDVHYEQPAPPHRARDPVDLADPLLHALWRAERATATTLATPEQNLAEMVLKMRLVDAMGR